MKIDVKNKNLMLQYIFRIGFLFLILLTTLHVSSAASLPSIPLIASGNVYINGESAPVGTVVKAIVGGDITGSTTLSQSGVYGITVGSGSGTVELYVNDVKANSVGWSMIPITLDLSVTIQEQTETTQTPSASQPTVTPTQTPDASALTSESKPTPESPQVTETAVVADTPISVDTVEPEAQATVLQDDIEATQVPAEQNNPVEASGFGLFTFISSIIVVSRRRFR